MRDIVNISLRRSRRIRKRIIQTIKNNRFPSINAYWKLSNICIIKKIYFFLNGNYLKTSYSAEERTFEAYSFSTPIGSLVHADAPSSAQSGFESSRESAPSAFSLPTRGFVCRGEDSNLHGLPRLLLRQVRLPISPPRHKMCLKH